MVRYLCIRSGVWGDAEVLWRLGSRVSCEPVWVGRDDSVVMQPSWVCMKMGGWGWVSSSVVPHLIFWDKVCHWTWSSVIGYQAPGMLLFLPSALTAFLCSYWGSRLVLRFPGRHLTNGLFPKLFPKSSFVNSHDTWYLGGGEAVRRWMLWFRLLWTLAVSFLHDSMSYLSPGGLSWTGTRCKGYECREFWASESNFLTRGMDRTVKTQSSVRQRIGRERSDVFS